MASGSKRTRSRTSSSATVVSVEPGMAFSIEPGVYRAGSHGARIEDIVVCTEDGYVSCNNRPHDLIVVDI